MTASLDLSACPVPWWLPERQTQTLFGALLAPANGVRFIRERVETPDGDFVDMDWTAPGVIAQLAETMSLGRSAHRANAQMSSPLDTALPHGTAAARWMVETDRERLAQLDRDQDLNALVLFHGLEGSSRSRYAQSIAQYFRARGWVVVIPNFRGCSGVPNRLARAYHSGDTEEISFILEAVRARLPSARWHAAGISLGGNALLKFLGQYPERSHWIHAAAGVSVPIDLVTAGNHLSDDPFNRQVYSRYFLRTLKTKVLEKAQRFPGVIDVMRVSQARDLRDFDDAYTAPMHGFRNALDYWTQSASKPWLRSIARPTLVLNARNDPFLPQAVLPGPAQVSAQVLLHQPNAGGHAGFVTGPLPGNLKWLPARLATFFSGQR